MVNLAPRARIAVVTALVFVAVVLLALGPALDVVTHPSHEAPPKGPDDVNLVRVSRPSRARLWPFTSRRKRFETLTLPINVAVAANASRTRRLLTHRTRADWHGADGEWRGATAPLDDADPWYDARGATRYTYVATPSPRTGGWTDETAELQVGNYFGTRYHLRLYEGGRGDAAWTAIQAHHEYWDWFRLRHTVGSTARAQRYVERRFYDRPSVRSVDRRRFGNGGISDADGWATVVDLTDASRPAGPALSAVAVAVALSRWRSLRRHVRAGALPGGRDTARMLALFATLAVLPLAVRHGAIAVGNAVPALPRKLVAGAFYPVLAVGPPFAAVHWGRDLLSHRGAVVTVAGFGTGLFVDYALLRLDAVPLAVLFHHLVALAALGLVAATSGLASRRPDASWTALQVGALVAWFGTLAWPLVLGY